MLVRVTTTLRKANSPAKDDVKNVMHLLAPSGSAVSQSQADAWFVPVRDFYNSLALWMSPSLSRGALAHDISFARVTSGGVGADDDVVSAKPLVKTWTLGAADAPGTGNKALPPEVAVTLSHTGYTVSPGEGGAGGTNEAARRRGRIYIGPLGTVAVTAGAVDPTLTTLLVTSFQTMVNAFRAIITPANIASVGIYSPTSDTFWHSQRCHVDNAFDTVRTRGVLATARSEQFFPQTPEGDSDAE